MKNLFRKLSGTHGPTIIGRSMNFFRRLHDELERGATHCAQQMTANHKAIVELDQENTSLHSQTNQARRMQAAIANLIEPTKCN